MNIAVKVLPNEYPTLLLTVTDNGHMLRDKVVLDSVDSAVERIREWLNRAVQKMNERYVLDRALATAESGK